jgi:hypothetical protein
VSARLFLSLVLLALAGCNTAVKVDPEGYRCDVGNTCPLGYACKDGFCRASVAVDPSCDGVTCNAPPAPSCASGTLLRTYAGRCVAGQCQYDAVDSACGMGCADGACVDPCATVACTTPPAPACTDASTLRTFAQAGTCTMGACSYTSTDTSCPNGCQDGTCKGVDLCRGITCTTPPPATCTNTTTRRTFAPTGTCTSGTCTYAQTDTPCPNGCALGQCLAASLTFAQTGPRLRFAVNGLDVAPGSSGNSALAVGNGGKLARWDGALWTELPTNTTSNLNRVAFVTGALAYAVGAQRTALTVRPTASSGQVMPVTLSGSGSANLVAVSGRSEGEVLLAGETGEWWRLLSGNWTQGSLPGSGNWSVSGAYLDESLRERIVGTCGSTPAQCVGYRFATGGTPSFVVHGQAGTPGFTAVGGGFDVPGQNGSTAILGLGDNGLATHSNTGSFGSLTSTPPIAGNGVIGVTAQSVALGRDVFVLTSSRDAVNPGAGRGTLYRLSRSTTQVSATAALDTYFGEEKLSPNDANGVLVAEVRRAAGVNNIFRRGTITNEALDVAEDFVGASVDDLGALVLVSKYGDVVTRRAAASTFDFRRPPVDWSITGFEARNGTGLVMVGADGSGNDGVIVRVTTSGFNTLTTRAGAVFNAVCRASDTEGWAVGDSGVIYRLSGANAVAVTSPTTKDLLTVDCAPGVAVAAGADGTVLRYANSTWAPVSPAFPRAAPILSARLTSQGALLGGDDFLYGFVEASSTWAQLPSRPGLRALVVRSTQEVYGAYALASGSEVRRFDGATWSSSLLQVSGVLGGGVQAGASVVWGGTLGAIVEGR